MRIFDSDIAYGCPERALPGRVETADEALAEMDHCGIANALVWHYDAYCRDFATGNRRVAQLAGHSRLHPCFTFVPPCCDEMPSPEGLLAEMRAAGARAARAFPGKHCFCMDSVSCGELFEAFIAASIPVFLPLPELSDRWNGVYRIMKDFPRLRLVLTQTGCWGEDRYFRPLMKAFPGFHITTDRFETAGQLKSLVDSVGPQQLLFASGLPFNYPGGYILMLARAEIGDSAKEAIACSNIERLLGEAQP